MKGIDMLDIIENINPAHVNEAIAASNIKKTNWLRKFTAIAACIAVLLCAGAGVYGYTDAKAYDLAVSFFSEYKLSMEGLTRSEIKNVYQDILTGSFTYEKTAEVIVNSMTEDQMNELGGLENSTPNEVAQLWNQMHFDDGLGILGTESTEEPEPFIRASAVKSYETFRKYVQQKEESVQLIRYIEPVGRTADIPLDRLMDTSRPLVYFDDRCYYALQNDICYGKLYFTDSFDWGVYSIAIGVDYMVPGVFDDINDRVFMRSNTAVDLNTGKGINWGGLNVVPYTYNKGMFTGTDISFLTDAYSNGYVYVNFNDTTSAMYSNGELIRLFFMYKDVTVTVYPPADTDKTIPDVSDSINGFVADLMNLNTMSSVTAKFDAAMKAEYGTAN